MEKQFKKYCFMSDNDGHNYLIPYELKKEWERLSEATEGLEEYSEAWDDIIEQFNETFGEYRHDDVFSTPFYLKVE
jgi:uncharacterized protein YrzB (UPF0473 family)